MLDVNSRKADIPYGINKINNNNERKGSPIDSLAKSFVEMLMPTTTVKPSLDLFGMLNPESRGMDSLLPQAPVIPLNPNARQFDFGTDRLVLREGAGAEPEQDLLTKTLGGPWQERGVKWAENGNILLVNRSGNRFLGSELAVRDRTVEIPFNQWLNLASNLMDMAEDRRI
ncbi:unnamed protein product [Bursaphelenchus xylophilus]|uniref:(pine wood nematode) hypothetical protein n=1 Tax=Bursaphelenchus xylophilus TaxID=6326 RepID=A0A1I7S975_BURXY|nr:unnamed protein product [Bursaphelenchus xylophilus]CAG9100413.1 unnamed protein product [Bursaphelenchus xylophilus]